MQMLGYVSVCDNILSECAFYCYVWAKERQTDWTPFNTRNAHKHTHAHGHKSTPFAPISIFVPLVVCLPKRLHSNSHEAIVFGTSTRVCVSVRVFSAQCLTRVRSTLLVKQFKLYFINATTIWYCWLDVYALWIQKCLCTIWTMEYMSIVLRKRIQECLQWCACVWVFVCISATIYSSLSLVLCFFDTL